jgi:fructose-1,6-bisphosphatase I
MEEIFKAIKESAKRISLAINDVDVSKTQSTNATGDTQLKLDVLSDKIIEECFASIPSVKSLISEEKDEALHVNDSGRFIIGYDPLDGSSLVDVNLSVGSIFGIYEGGISGAHLKSAAYVVYGPRTELVIADEEVKHYRLGNDGEFRLLGKLNLNQKGKLNAPGGTQQHWPKFHKELIDSLFQNGYRLRYSGGMVPDLHQILCKGGGLFSYPSTTDVPKGKLRLVFEVFPFAFIYEKAGGKAIDGYNRLLELTPSHPHDTSPCFFGSNTEISQVVEAYEQNS